MKKNYVTIVCLLIICAAAVIYATAGRDSHQVPQRLHAYVNPADIQSISIARGDQSIYTYAARHAVVHAVPGSPD